MNTGTFCFPRSGRPLFAAAVLGIALAVLPLRHGTALGAVSQAPRGGWFVDMNRYAASAHGSLKCEECHGPMAGKGMRHPDDKAPGFLATETRRVFDYTSCGRCHKTSVARYMTGEHARALVKEKETGQVSKTGRAPTCGDCHSAHYAPSHLSRSETGRLQTGTCGACHPSQKASFLADYHGKAAVNLGYDKSAFCTDCHGAHACLSLKEAGEALAACRRCHPEAGDGFAGIVIHDTREDLDKKSEAKQAAVRRIGLFGFLSFAFVTGLLILFYSHTGLLMLRKLHETLRRHK